MPASRLPDVAALRRDDCAPRWGLILGSGLGPVASALRDASATPFGAIPGLVPPSVEGHRGVMHQGWLDGVPVAVLEGRLHTYEGLDPAQATFHVRVLAALGIHSLIVTNAAGGLNPHYAPGSLMLITDHINLPALTGESPLRGAGYPDLPRFVSMGDAYDPTLRTHAVAAAGKIGLELHEGVYVMVSGPSYETPAEVRFLRAAGGDAVGMSTAAEVIVARQLGLRVLGLSCIANAAYGATEGDVGHLDVLETVRRQAPSVVALLRELLRRDP